ncbi:hypothetical protein GGS24DRAFT_472221 [Hypoxylon argillaceum]|nr:hypothetical protein GGS24DRAFT_472221 [Hypoxylon argillaceum]
MVTTPATVQQRLLETLDFLIDKGADVNLQGGLYGTALQVAAYLGALDIARLLVDNGAEPNLQGGRFDTALQAAAWAGSLETVKFLFNKGADVNLQGGECGTALQAAVMRRNLEVTEFLIENGADLDHKDAFQLTALHHAVRTRNVEIVKLLLDRNACADTRDHAGITPFEAAIDVQNKDIILMLLSRTKPRPLLSAKRWRNALNCKRRRCLKFTFDEVLFIEEIERPRGRDKTERLMGVGATFLTDKLYYSRRIDFPKAAIYVVLNSGMLEVTPSSCFEYQWWRNRLLGESEPWSKTSSSLPSLDLCKQLDRNNFFVECWFTISCLTITEDNWPLPQSSIPEEYNDLKRIEGFYWATIRWPSENSSPDTPIEDLLRPIFSSTTCEDSVVDLVKGIGDLLIPLIDKFDHTFEDNVYWANRQLSSSRREVLKNGGSNPDLIHHLLSDATVIEHISGDYARIIQSLKKLIGHVRGLQKGPWKLSGESLYESKKKLEVLQRHRDAWRELSEKAQSLIGLEFNLASILEARRSTSTNRSLKRLTWVTFVFLPLLFVSSLFGMNVDILSHDPSWWYYFPIAGGFLLFTFAVWIFFKRYDSLEGSLEKHFAWLVKRHKKNGHGKEQADTGHSWLYGGKLKLRKLELSKLEVRNLGLGKLGLRKRREKKTFLVHRY